MDSPHPFWCILSLFELARNLENKESCSHCEAAFEVLVSTRDLCALVDTTPRKNDAVL